jgi:hypothetical protein
MMKRFTIPCLMIFTVLVLSVNGLAQSQDEAELTNRSRLADADLPAGAFRLKESLVPAHIKTILAKIIEGLGSEARQGDSEVIVWIGPGNTKAKYSQMMKTVRENLQAAGWEYRDLGTVEDERNSEISLVALKRTQPKGRALVGFFGLNDKGLVLALTEVLRADTPRK